MELSNHEAYSSFSGTSCRKRLLSPSLLGDTLEVVLVLLLLLLLFTTALTSSGVGMVDREPEKGRRLSVNDALRVPGTYLADGRSSSSASEDWRSE